MHTVLVHELNYSGDLLGYETQILDPNHRQYFL